MPRMPLPVRDRTSPASRKQPQGTPRLPLPTRDWTSPASAAGLPHRQTGLLLSRLVGHLSCPAGLLFPRQQTSTSLPLPLPFPGSLSTHLSTLSWRKTFQISMTLPLLPLSQTSATTNRNRKHQPSVNDPMTNFISTPSLFIHMELLMFN